MREHIIPADLVALATPMYYSACRLNSKRLPGEDGLTVCRRLRTPGMPYEYTPVIFLTALGELTDRVVGLELGADDYLAKPFQVRELVARIRALLRRASAPRPGEPDQSVGAKASLENKIWSFWQWRLKVLSRHLIDRGGVVIPLSAAKFKLLMLFLDNPEQVISRDTILEYMADSAADVSTLKLFCRVSLMTAQARAIKRRSHRSPLSYGHL